MSRSKSQALPQLNSPGSVSSNEGGGWMQNSPSKQKRFGAFGSGEKSDDDEDAILDGGSDAGQATSEQHSSIGDDDDLGPVYIWCLSHIL